MNDHDDDQYDDEYGDTDTGRGVIWWVIVLILIAFFLLLGSSFIGMLRSQV